MSDENKTEQVEQTNDSVEVKQEQPVEQPKPSQFDIDKVVKDRLYRQEKQLLESLGVSNLDEAKAAIEERKKVEEEKQLERGKFDEVMKKKSQEFNEKL